MSQVFFRVCMASYVASDNSPTNGARSTLQEIREQHTMRLQLGVITSQVDQLAQQVQSKSLHNLHCMCNALCSV